MFLKQTKTRDGRIYLSVVEGYRQNGKTRQRTVEKIGYLDDLQEVHGDPIAHFRAYAAKLTEQKARDNAKVTIEFSPAEKIDARDGEPRIGLGSIPLSFAYHGLQLDRFWAKKKNRAGLAFDPNAAFRMLAYERVLHPGSKRSAYSHAGELPDRCDFTLDHVYQALSFFAKHEEAFKAHMDAAVGKVCGRDISTTYYDVTNYYFEVENEDDLRRYGVGKEHRPCPIVQMGLMMDKNGIPLDYELYPGSFADPKTLEPAFERVKGRHPGTRLVVVADKALNTSANIARTVANGDGFIFSQSVRKATKGLREWVLDERDYDASESGNFKMKSRQAYKPVKVKCADGGTRTERVEVQEVAFWSRNFAERSRHERAKVVEKSMRAVERGDVASARAKTPLRYINDTAYATESGEVVGHSYVLDEAKIAAEEAMDGYYCIVTSEVNMDEGEVIDAYRQLWRIEDTFRVTKSTLEARPVYVSTKDHIHAHFMTCYAALVIMRLLQAALGWKYSADEIAEALRSLVGYREDANWYLFSYRSELTDAIGDLIGIGLNRRRLTRGDIRQMLADSRKPGYGVWLKG